MSIRRTMVVVIAFAGCLVAAGCSSSGGKTEKPPSTAQLRSVVLKQADLPSGWTGTPSTATGSDPDVQAKLLSCIGAKGVDLGTKLNQAQSEDFSTAQDTANVSSSASSFKTEKFINSRVTLLKDSKAESCLSQSLQSSLAKKDTGSTKFGTPAFSVRTGPADEPGNVAAVANGTVDVTAQGQHATIYVDLYFIRGPLLTATVQFTGVAKQVDAGLQKKLVATVAARAAKP